MVSFVINFKPFNFQLLNGDRYFILNLFGKIKFAIYYLYLMKQFLILIILLAHTAICSAQIDFSSYQHTTSKGKLPRFLKIDVATLVRDDIKNKRVHFINSEDEEDFLNLAYQRLNKRFLAGDCIFGDPVSTYLENLAKQCFSESPSSIKDFEFVVVNSNAAFVRGVYPGVIFISTGLIAQTENEAQLSYWLLQAIAQVQLNLDQKIYLQDAKQNAANFDQISPLDLEFELSADSLAILNYKKLNFGYTNLTTAYLVRIYSYLPYEDIPMNRTYFNTAEYFLPEMKFGNKPYEIKSPEELKYSEQKNLNIRRAAMERYALNIAGDKSYFNSTSSFQDIKTIARLELIRTSMREKEYVLGLYQIYVMEEQIKSNLYLDQLKAFAWYHIVAIRENNKIRYQNFVESNCQGEICHLYHLLLQKDIHEIQTLGLRTIYDLHKKHSTDAFISLIYNEHLVTLAKSSKFNYSDYATKSYYEVDSINKIQANQQNSTESASKYDKIAIKKSQYGIDTNTYYLYGIADIIRDNKFERKFDLLKDSIKTADSPVDVSKMSPEEKYKYQKQKAKQARLEKTKKFGIDTVLIVNPTLYFKGNSKISTEKRVSYSDELTENLKVNATKSKVYYDLLDLNSIRKAGNSEYNKMILYAALGKALMNSNDYDNDKIILDYIEFLPYIKNENQRYVLFPVVHYYANGSLQYRLVLYDILLGKVLHDETSSFNGKPSKSVYNVMVFHFFKKFKG